LQGIPYEKDGIKIYGWDGWYHERPLSNDFTHMFPQLNGVEFHSAFTSRAQHALEKILEEATVEETNIAVTHFNLLPQFEDWDVMKMDGNHKFLDFVKEKFNYHIFGHSHVEYYREHGNCLVLNSGSGYNEPMYKLIEIGDNDVL